MTIFYCFNEIIPFGNALAPFSDVTDAKDFSALSLEKSRTALRRTTPNTVITVSTPIYEPLYASDAIRPHNIPFKRTVIIVPGTFTDKNTAASQGCLED